MGQKQLQSKAADELLKQLYSSGKEENDKFTLFSYHAGASIMKVSYTLLTLI